MAFQLEGRVFAALAAATHEAPLHEATALDVEAPAMLQLLRPAVLNMPLDIATTEAPQRLQRLQRLYTQYIWRSLGVVF